MNASKQVSVKAYENDYLNMDSQKLGESFNDLDSYLQRINYNI